MVAWTETEDVITQIRTHALDNISFFTSGANPVAEQFIEHFNEILKNLSTIFPIAKNLSAQMHRFDYDADHKGNGYRSLFNYCKRTLEKLLIVVDKVTKQRSTVLFGIRKGELCNGVKAWTKLLAQVGELLKIGSFLLDSVNDDNLFFSINESAIALSLKMADKVICMDAFLDRPLGFQYTESLTLFVNVIVSLTAGLSDVLKLKNQSFLSIGTLIPSAHKYLFNPEFRASKALEVLLTADIAFSKMLWECNIKTLARMLAQITIGKVILCDVITLKEKTVLVDKNNRKNYNITTTTEDVEVSLPPSSDNVKVKCITDCMCESMLEKLGLTESALEIHVSSSMKLIDTIMFHIHGGGFIANDSYAHELYLRVWAKEIGIPIFSVHYSLSPETVFPQALEECYYAYAWMLVNKPLGWSGKYIVIAGDSAGGNLITSLVIKCIMTNLRLPDAMFSFYPVLSLITLQSPSRILSFVDPILNISTMQNCVMAYCGIKEDESAQDKDVNSPSPTDSLLESGNESDKDKKNLQAAEKLKTKFRILRCRSQMDNQLLSPLLADEAIFKQFPPTYVFTSECDPLLDDSVALAKRLREAGIKHELLIVPEIPHGFLSLRFASSQCLDAFKKSMQTMKKVITDLYST